MRPQHGGPQRRPNAGHPLLLQRRGIAAFPSPEDSVEHALEVDGEPRDVAGARVVGVGLTAAASASAAPAAAARFSAVAVPPLVVGEHAAPRPEQPRDDGVKGAPRGGPAVDEDDGGGGSAWKKGEGAEGGGVKERERERERERKREREKKDKNKRRERCVSSRFIVLSNSPLVSCSSSFPPRHAPIKGGLQRPTVVEVEVFFPSRRRRRG